MKQKRVAVAINLDWPLKRYHDLYKGIQEYAKLHADWLLIWDHFPEQRLRECESESYYDGVIGRIKYEAYDEIKRLKIPVVNTWSSSSLKEVTTVDADHFHAGKLAAEHLLMRGFRNFVNIDYSASWSSTMFYKGFAKAIKPYECPIKRHLVSNRCDEVGSLWNKFNKDFKDWIKEWKYPLAISCSLSSMGPKITTRCLEHGLRVPEDVAVISAGNDLSYCEGFYPSISSVEIDFHKVGYESARQLDMKMKGEKIEEKTTLIKPTSCIARESTDSYAVNDKDLQKSLRYICDNYQNSIQVVDVVESTQVSRSTLERKFSETIGHSIFGEINRLRITSAQRLLLETDLEVKKISKSSGFSSSHHFIRAFKSSTGLIPTEYRKVNQR